MKNKVVIIFMVLFLFFIVLLIGCAETTTLNVEGKGIVQSPEFINICDGNVLLNYDTSTGIVYIKNYTHSGNYVYTPYYAPNGLPYRYNSETNMFEEIDSYEK